MNEMREENMSPFFNFGRSHRAATVWMNICSNHQSFFIWRMLIYISTKWLETESCWSGSNGYLCDTNTVAESSEVQVLLLRIFFTLLVSLIRQENAAPRTFSRDRMSAGSGSWRKNRMIPVLLSYICFDMSEYSWRGPYACESMPTQIFPRFWTKQTHFFSGFATVNIDVSEHFLLSICVSLIFVCSFGTIFPPMIQLFDHVGFRQSIHVLHLLLVTESWIRRFGPDVPSFQRLSERAALRKNSDVANISYVWTFARSSIDGRRNSLV